MASTTRDYYEVLGVGRNAGSDDIRNAFRQLAKRYHPDVNKDTGAEERFKEINEAYGVLSDAERRSVYDRFGHAGLSGMPGNGAAGMEDLSDLFAEFFRGFGMGASRGRRTARRGQDLQTEVVLTFEEAVFGVEKDVEVTRQEPCSACKGSRAEPGTSPTRCPVCKGSGEERHVRETFLGSMVNVSTCSKCGGLGEIITTPCKACRGQGLERKTRTLKVPIPAGVDNGTQIRLAGEGGPGLFGGPQGNLYAALRVEPHAYLHRRNFDLYLEVGVNFAQAALGDELKFKVLDSDIALKVPPGTQPGQVFRMRGKGVPRLQQNGRGDLLVVVNVRVPDSLSAAQKKLLDQLGGSFDRAPSLQKSKLVDTIKDLFGD